jgi:hypothetical protein
MSEYCSQCSPFKSLGEYDFDLFKMAVKVKRCRSISFVCEGFNNRAIYKDENGNLFLVKKEEGEMVFYPVNLVKL